MPDSHVVEESYVSQRLRWYRRWRWPLILLSIVVWLPVLILLQWKLHITTILQEQGFYWLPGLDAPDLSLWHRSMLRLSYNLEYYTQILMRVIAVAAAIALALHYRPVAAGRGEDKARIYLDYRHAVRRAVYWAMLMFLLLPSLAAKLVREAGITSEGFDLGVIGFPLLLLVADWFSQCEFQQWLILRFRRLSFSWYFGLTLLLTALYFYSNYYLPLTEHWGRLSLTPYYGALTSAFLLSISVLTAILWRQHTVLPTEQMVFEIEGELNKRDRAQAAVAGAAKAGQTATAQRIRFWVPRRYIYLGLSLFALLGIAYLMVLRSGVLYDPDIYPNPDFTIPVISTREHFYYGTLNQDYTPYEYELLDPANRLAGATDTTGDVLIIVHGFNNHPRKAQYKFDLGQASARFAGFEGLVIGFSWDADTHHDPFSATGYHTGDLHAEQNGPKLAQFVTDFKNRHPEVRVHLIGYSMGARVVLEALMTLDRDPQFAGSGVVLDSVHLLGASVDSEEVELGEKYGAAIEARTVALFNYWSAVDVALGSFYWIKEADRSLGEMCIEHPDAKPANYFSVDASRELVTYDASCRPEPEKLGQNHKGYLGAKDTEGKLLDDGALNLVVANIERSRRMAQKGDSAGTAGRNTESEQQQRAN